MSGRLAHYIKKNSEIKNLQPMLFSSFYVDLYDFHSNIKISKKFCVSVPIIEVDNEITWTKDMFKIESPYEIESIEIENKDQLKKKFNFSIEKFDFLKDILFNSIVNFFKIELYKNNSLSIFSELGESKENFINRCFKISLDKYEYEIKQIRKTSEMEFEQLKEKFDKKEYINDFEKEKVKDSFYEAKWVLEKIFLNFKRDTNFEIPLSNEASQDLISIVDKTLKKMESLFLEVKKTAEDVEKYSIHLSPKNISDFTVGILWK